MITHFVTLASAATLATTPEGRFRSSPILPIYADRKVLTDLKRGSTGRIWQFMIGVMGSIGVDLNDLRLGS
jgi:hypothetical protein